MGRLRVSLVLCRVSASLCLVADCVLEGVVFPLALTGFAVVRAALQLLVGRVVGRASRRRFVTPTLCARAFRGRPRSTRRLRTPFLCQVLDLSYDGFRVASVRAADTAKANVEPLPQRVS